VKPSIDERSNTDAGVWAIAVVAFYGGPFFAIFLGFLIVSSGGDWSSRIGLAVAGASIVWLSIRNRVAYIMRVDDQGLLVRSLAGVRYYSYSEVAYAFPFNWWAPGRPMTAVIALREGWGPTRKRLLVSSQGPQLKQALDWLPDN
jgi:hypothetical protein